MLYPNNLAEDQFVIGRNAMVCCENDMSFLAILAFGEKPKPQSYCQVTGVLLKNSNSTPMAILQFQYYVEVPVPKDPIIRL